MGRGPLSLAALVYAIYCFGMDRITYRGVVYTRSKGRPYYSAPRGHDGESLLHRQIYADHHGPIPDGYLVHHADHDKSNNDPSNLVALTRKEHAAEHRNDELWSSDEWQAHLTEIREKATEWHRSDEGRAWHREHGRKVWEGRERFDKPCEHCGSVFPAATRRARFCGRNCIAAARRRRVRVVSECAECGKPFEQSEALRQVTCGPSCGGKRGARKRRGIAVTA